MSSGAQVDGCSRPTYAGSVVSRTKDELRGSIVARTDVGHIRLPADQLLSTAHKVKAHSYHHHRTLLPFGQKKVNMSPKDRIYTSEY